MLDERQTHGIGRAINEAAWFDVLPHRLDERILGFGFGVLTLPETGPEPSQLGRVRWMWLGGVSRLAVSLRNALWNDPDAPAQPIALEALCDVHRSFDAQPVYGWDFVDCGDDAWQGWRARLSLDITLDATAAGHTIELFQESAATPIRHLDLKAWFETISVFDNDGTPVDLEEFIAGGDRWWQGLHTGDSRIDPRHGVVPAGPGVPPPPAGAVPSRMGS